MFDVSPAIDGNRMETQGEAAHSASLRLRHQSFHAAGTPQFLTQPVPAWLSVAALIAVICGALPLLAGRPAALEDWPGHVARVEILAQLLAGNSFWSQFYQINTFLLPNISVDLGILALHTIGLSIAVAAEVTLLATYVLFVGAASALAWALRAADPLKPLIAVALFYNGALMDGFVNYMLGAGVALCFLTAWVRASTPVSRLLIALSGGVVVVFCHIIAAGFFLCVLGLLELTALLRVRQWNMTVLCRHASSVAAAVPIFILFALSPTSGASDINYGNDLSVQAILKSKLSLFVHPVVDGSGPLGAAILLIGGLLFAGAVGVAVRRGHLVLRALPGWFVLVPGLFALFLLAPNGVGDGLGLDYRLPPLVFLLTVLFVQLDWRNGRVRLLCFAILLLVSLARSASLTRDAVANQAVYRGFATAARTIPDDSMLLSGIGTPRTAIPWSEFWRPPAEYMGTLAIADRVFVPSVFALRSQHTLVLRDVFRGLGRQFDVSDPDAVAEMRGVAHRTCALWQGLGHRGAVFMVVVYPSAFSDGVFVPAARRAAGEGFRLIDLCVMG
jgi:hypothetical protein